MGSHNALLSYALTAQCIHCTMHSLHSAFTAQCTHCTMHSLHSAFTDRGSHNALLSYALTAQCTVHSLICALCGVHGTGTSTSRKVSSCRSMRPRPSLASPPPCRQGRIHAHVHAHACMACICMHAYVLRGRVAYMHACIYATRASRIYACMHLRYACESLPFLSIALLP